MADTPDYDRPGANPPPVPAPEGAVSAHDIVADDLLANFGHGLDVQRAVEGIRARKAYGLKKYGTVLWASDKRDHLQDILDEAEDKAAYLANAMTADPELVPVLQEVYGAELAFLIVLRGLMVDRYGALAIDDTGEWIEFQDSGGRVCGARMPSQRICIRPLDAGTRCPEHGGRHAPVVRA